MARDRGPQCKQCRREGIKLFLKGERCLTDKCGVERRAYPPGDHGRGRQESSPSTGSSCARSRRPAASTACSRSSSAATTPRRVGSPGVTGEKPAPPARDPLRQRPRATRLRGLEAPGTAAGAARTLDHQRSPVNIPSYQVRPDEVIALKAGSGATQTIRDATELISVVPAWLQADHDGPHGEGTAPPGAVGDRHSGAGAADRRAVFEVVTAAALRPALSGPAGEPQDAKETLMLEFQTPQISAENVEEKPRHVHDRAARPRLRLHVSATPCAVCCCRRSRERR